MGNNAVTTTVVETTVADGQRRPNHRSDPQASDIGWRSFAYFALGKLTTRLFCTTCAGAVLIWAAIEYFDVSPAGWALGLN